MTINHGLIRGTILLAILPCIISNPANAFVCANEDTTSPSSITEEEFATLRKQARNNLYGGDWEQAAADYSEAIKHAAGHDKLGFLYRGRGTAYALLGEWEKALCDANKFIEMNPEHLNAFTERGSYFMEIGAFENALDDFNEAISRHPIEGVWFNASKAKALIGLGRCSEALASAKIAKRSNPEDKYLGTFVYEIEEAGQKCKTILACKISNKECDEVAAPSNDQEGEFKP